VVEDLLLAGREVIAQRALVLAPSSGDAQAQSLEPIEARVFEWMRKKPCSQVLVAVGVEVAAATVLRAVKSAGRILQQPGPKIAWELQANVSVRHQLRGQSSLDEEQVLPALQPLQSHRLLELAGLHLEFRQNAIVDVGVEQVAVV